MTISNYSRGDLLLMKKMFFTLLFFFTSTGVYTAGDPILDYSCKSLLSRLLDTDPIIFAHGESILSSRAAGPIFARNTSNHTTLLLREIMKNARFFEKKGLFFRSSDGRSAVLVTQSSRSDGSETKPVGVLLKNADTNATDQNVFVRLVEQAQRFCESFNLTAQVDKEDWNDVIKNLWLPSPRVFSIEKYSPFPLNAPKYYFVYHAQFAAGNTGKDAFPLQREDRIFKALHGLNQQSEIFAPAQFYRSASGEPYAAIITWFIEPGPGGKNPKAGIITNQAKKSDTDEELFNRLYDELKNFAKFKAFVKNKPNGKDPLSGPIWPDEVFRSYLPPISELHLR